jgi:hypothetical protein
VYQLTCNTCHKRYIGQTGRSFKTRFKEHHQDYKHNWGKSLYAKHIPQHDHSSHPIQNSMHILHTPKKGRLLNAIENFYIHREIMANNQLNETRKTKPNIVFDVIIRHTQPLTSHTTKLTGLPPRPSYTSHRNTYTPVTAIHTRHRSTHQSSQYTPDTSHHHITQHRALDKYTSDHHLNIAHNTNGQSPEYSKHQILWFHVIPSLEIIDNFTTTFNQDFNKRCGFHVSPTPKCSDRCLIS